MQLKTIPQHIAVVGRGTTVVEWAYALSRVATVTLISLSQPLLPAEDHDIQRLSKAQLSSLGIEVVYLSSSAGVDDAVGLVRAEKVLVIPQRYGWANLGLEQLGIVTGGGIAVNRYLQTNCAHIYASGDSLGGENRPELTQQETAIALENALFGRRHIMRYETAFYAIHWLSPIGRWGLTEHQARQRYSQVEIFQASCLPANSGHVAQTNFCKLVTVDARIAGVHLMGDNASSLAIALGQMANMSALSQWAMGSFKQDTLQDAIYQATQQWQSRHWREGQWRRDWTENWFNWRRSL